jgi:hypothetical protein
MKPSSTDPSQRGGLGRREFLRLSAHGVAGAALWTVAHGEAPWIAPVGSVALPVAIGWWAESQRLLAAGKPALSAYDPSTGSSDRVILAPSVPAFARIIRAEDLSTGVGSFTRGARVHVHGVHAAPAVARAGAVHSAGVSGIANVRGTATSVRFLAWSLQTKPGVNHSAPVKFRTPVGSAGLRLALDGVGYGTRAESSFALKLGSAAGPKLREGIYVIGFPMRDGSVPDLSQCKMRALSSGSRAYRLMLGTKPAPFAAIILSVTQA